MSLFTTTPDFLVREADGDYRPAGTLVLGRGLRIADTAGGVPELLPGSAAEAVVVPSGGDDTARIQAALDTHPVVRLGPGTFVTSAPLRVPAGGTLAGSGAGRTTVQVNGPSRGVDLLEGDTAVEGLRLVGAGPSGGYVDGIVGWWDAPAPQRRRVRLADLAVTDFGLQGIALGGVSEVAIRDVAVERTTNRGLNLHGAGGTVSGFVLSNVAVRQCGGDGVQIAYVHELACAGVTVEDAPGSGMLIHQCERVHLSACRMERCHDSLELSYCGEATVDACVSRGAARWGLRIFAGAAATVNGFLSDQSSQAVWMDAPHLVVGGGATQVLVASFRRVNQFPAPTWEADVSGAGGRVVFIQNDFTAGKVSSGGNYAQL